MFKVECTHAIKIGDTDFGLADFVKLFVENEPYFGRSQAALFAGVRLVAAPHAIESADMAHLRTALESPSNGYGLTPALAAAPFVRAIVEAKES